MISIRIAFLLLFPTISILAQEEGIIEKGHSKLVCTYIHTYQPFKNDTLSVNQKFILVMNDQFSKYMNFDSYLYDKALKEEFQEKKLGKNSSIAKIITFTNIDIPQPESNDFSVMKDLNTKDVTYIYNLGYITNCSFTENYNDLKWTITNNTKNINGFYCIQATTTYGFYEIEAWFTPEIPVSDGPYLFAGLPGLIISLNDQNNMHSFMIDEVASDSTIMLTDNISGRKFLAPIGIKQAQKNIKKKRKQLELGYDIEQNNPLYPQDKLPMLEDQSDKSIKKLKLKYTLYDHLLFRFISFENNL
ncbi:GLPGLI family protein (plasmid) [Flammeovirga pectinis]|uniref:GLPGLI family protein n=1 Tax=Flammeovirga pectinis TaxID=2494373 RepID=A0A3S9PBS3_9BACT|nr:GLPGLI family protein [Flammeovirga pectinis]AZQ65644.1 GLPGLI family protein [Flammeovirga pectinis]